MRKTVRRQYPTSRRKRAGPAALAAVLFIGGVERMDPGRDKD
jgi:hypothetical protein